MNLLQRLGDAMATQSPKAQALLPKSGWASRKLWIYAGLIMGLLYLAHGNLPSILETVVTLTVVYLITQAAHDIATDFCQAWIQRSKDRADADVMIARINKGDPLTTPCVTITATKP
jgi:hypothetical protein